MTTTYTLNGRKVTDIAMAVRNFLETSEKMETQCFFTNDGGAIIQARVRGGSVKKFVGLDKAITVKLAPAGEEMVNVDIGEAKWTDKGIALTVSWFVLWPLAVTSGIGIYKQHKLPEKINRVIQNSILFIA